LKAVIAEVSQHHKKSQEHKPTPTIYNNYSFYCGTRVPMLYITCKRCDTVVEGLGWRSNAVRRS
jgi:hypothetical protein